MKQMVISLFSLCLIITACNSKSNSNPSPVAPSSGENAPNNSSVSNSPDAGAASAAPVWKDLNYQASFEDLDPTGCDSPLRFKVNNDGSFLAGPCQNGHAAVPGKLADDELQKINALSRNVLAKDNGKSTCHNLSGDMVESAVVTMSTLDGKSIEVERTKQSTSEECARGSYETARELEADLAYLSQKYYPNP